MAQTSASNDPSQADDDHSLLMKPINIGSCGVQHMVRSLQNGTAEVRNLLLNECSVIYECKVCRSLHRSLANFIAHKRVYCIKHCCESMLLFEQPDIEKETVIVQPESPDSGTIQEEDYQSELTPAPPPSSIEKDQGNIPTEAPKILQSFSSSTAKSKATTRASLAVPKSASGGVSDEPESFYDKCAKHLENRASNQSKLVVQVKTIDSNHNAVFQMVQKSEDESSSSGVDGAKKKAFVEPAKGKTEDISTSLLQDAATNDQLKSKTKYSDGCCCTCFKCGAKFTSVKTMTIHLRSIHAKRRVYFPCPYCSAMFSQSWGVVRHLLTIHKKTKEQVNKLRSKIRQKAWQKATNDKDSDDEAGLQPQSQSASPIVKEVPKTVAVRSIQTASPTVNLKKPVGLHKCQHCSKIFTQSHSLAKHAEDCGPKDGTGGPIVKIESSSTSRPKRVVKKKVIKDFVNSSRLTIRSSTVSKGENVKRAPPNIEKKILSIIDTKKLECIQCRRPFTTLSNLRRHAAQHVGWNRYKCKYCDYQSYSRSECRNHVKRVHITKRQLQNQADKFIVDLPTDDVATVESFVVAASKSETPEAKPAGPTPTESKQVTSKKLPTDVSSVPKKATDVSSVPKKATDVSSVPKKATDVSSVPKKATDVSSVPKKATDVSSVPKKATDDSSVPKKTLAIAQPLSRQGSKRKFISIDEAKQKMTMCKKGPTVDSSDSKVSCSKKPSVVGDALTPNKKLAVEVKASPPLLPTVKRVEIPPQDPKPVQNRVKKGGTAVPSTTLPPSPAESVKMTNGTSDKPSTSVSMRKSPSLPSAQTPSSFNISTRLSPRHFDTSPYRPSSQVATLVTRSSTYVKSDPAPAAKREDSAPADISATKTLRKKPQKHAEPPKTQASTNGIYTELATSSRLCDHNYSVELNRVIKQEPVSDESC